MAHHFTQSIGLLTMIAVAILVGPLPSAEAKEKSVFKAHFVPVLAADGAAPAIQLTFPTRAPPEASASTLPTVTRPLVASIWLT